MNMMSREQIEQTGEYALFRSYVLTSAYLTGMGIRYTYELQKAVYGHLTASYEGLINGQASKTPT